MTERVPPYSLEAEQSVIGAILLDGECFDDVMPIIDERSFHSDACAAVFAVCRAMHGKRDRIDPLTVGERLEASGGLSEVGGHEFLSQCVEIVPHTLHADYYAKLVRDRWVRREIIYMSRQASNDAYDMASEAPEIVAAVQEKLNKLDEKTAQSASSSIADLLLDVATEIETGLAPGIKLGYMELDLLTNGLRPGNLVVIGARPSTGKTAFAGNIAMNVAKTGKSVLFFSVEQSSVEMAQRFLSLESGVSMHNLRGTMMDTAQREQVMQASNTLASRPIDIEDSSSWTATQIAACARRHCRKKQVDLIIVDYLQLMTAERHRDSREQQVAGMSRRMKQMAKETGCPTIVLAQLNRMVEQRTDKKPRLSDLRESGAVEQDADIVMLIDRPSDYDITQLKDEVIIHVAKNRNGPKGKAFLHWTSETMKLSDKSFADVLPPLTDEE